MILLLLLLVSYQHDHSSLHFFAESEMSEHQGRLIVKIHDILTLQSLLAISSFIISS